MNVCVVGLGYVGLTLSVALAKKGCNVVGIDSSMDVIEKISSGVSPFYDKGLSESLVQSLDSGKLKVSNNIQNLNSVFDFIIIAIGSPIKSNKETDISEFLAVVKSLTSVISNSSVLILRSTLPVGTSRMLQHYLIQLGISTKVSFCPERSVEGRALEELFELPQIISGFDEPTVETVETLFRKLTPVIVRVSSLEIAEVAKLASNMWRDFTFSFANELFMQTNELSVDVIEVINAANTNYPRNAIPLPGAVGGPCLSKDTYIFSQSIENYKHIFASAREVNSTMPNAVINRLQNRITGNVGILGWAFKGNPPTNDVRASPTFVYADLILEIEPRVKSVRGWDPEVIDGPKNVYWCNSVDELLADSDLILIANNHPYFKSKDFLNCINSCKQKITLVDLWGVISKKDLSNVSVELLNLGNI